MTISVISDPPNPNDAAYAANPKLYNQALYRWACALKSQLNQQNRTISRPTSQSFLATSYVTQTSITGTSTGTDIANVICTLISSLQQKGILSTLPVNQ